MTPKLRNALAAVAMTAASVGLPAAALAWQAGDRIEAQDFNGLWKPAVVTSIQGDMVFVRFEGRGPEDMVYLRQTRALRTGAASPDRSGPTMDTAGGRPVADAAGVGRAYAAGDRVEVEDGAGRWVLAVVTEVRGDMLFVRYDMPGSGRDGMSDGVRPKFVRPAATATATAADAARGEMARGMDLSGSWVIDIIGGAWTRVKYEDVDARTVRKIAEIEIQKGASDLGVLDVRPDGTYHINYRGVRTGRWERDVSGPYARLGGIVLRGAHPEALRGESDWYVFARDGGVEGSPPPYVGVGNYTLKRM